MTQRTAQAKQVGASGALDMRQSTLGIELHVLFEVIACQDGASLSIVYTAGRWLLSP